MIVQFPSHEVEVPSYASIGELKPPTRVVAWPMGDAGIVVLDFRDEVRGYVSRRGNARR